MFAVAGLMTMLVCVDALRVSTRAPTLTARRRAIINSPVGMMSDFEGTSFFREMFFRPRSSMLRRRWQWLLSAR